MSTSPTPASDATSSSLLGRLREHDPDAWSRLAKLYGPLVYRWARQAGLQASDAADVGQEVFRVVAARIGTFRHDREGATFRGWLWTITKNKLKEHHRKRLQAAVGVGGSAADRKMEEIAVELPDESTQFDRANAQAAVVRRAVQVIRSDFDDKTWRAFWQATIEDRPATEIAPQLGMTANAVRQAKFRVLRRLREELDQLL